MTASPTRRTLYIPYMCDHVYVLAAALTAVGCAVEVLPPPDAESLALGLEHCQGRECVPCLTTTGDIVRRARRPDFDPAQATILMPTAVGACRFGQYQVLHQEILARLGLGEVRFVSPSADNRYEGLGAHPLRLRRLCWQGVVAIDLLQRLLHEYRPYEVNVGDTDRCYQTSLDSVVAAVRAGAGRRLIAALHRVAADFAALDVDRRQRRPIIGLVGEIYLRFNEFTNGQVIRRVEAAGGEVMLASMMEWIYATNGWDYRPYYRRPYGPRDAAVSFLTNTYERVEERRLTRPVAHLLTVTGETPVGTLLTNLRPYYHPSVHSEAILSLGKAIDFAHHGVSGIINIMPFTCMPGLITAGIAPLLRRDLGHIPWLDVICHVQTSTNLQTRLEAFLYQARKFRRGPDGVVSAAGAAAR